jgi:CubicO group peptidase (beta-lactamase class C family)/RimJ/RimL family protein N-acetyltransferase
MSLEGLDEVATEVERFRAERRIPGVAVGVLDDARLVHHASAGETRVGGGVAPDVDTVFRIASMTKSFTAATLLLLRDEGALALDDPVARHVPELEGLALPTADSPPLTLRHLLTMSGGLPTDDPWGDRLQGLRADAFSALLRDGLTFAWAPGTRFEYSNLGYGILGRVITNVAGEEYRQVVRDRLLRPLGLDASGYALDEIDQDRLALGYVERDGTFQPEPIDPYGALAPMGGLFSTVRDVARWVAWLADAFPPRDEADGGPLSRASRREMQQVHRMSDPSVQVPDATGLPVLTARAYGFGLGVTHDLRLGQIVGHAGGYPGYGSYMCWHPASGVGVVGLGNARYAPLWDLSRRLLERLVAANPTHVRRPTPSVHARRAQLRVERLLRSWDEAEAPALFASNVELDEPLADRRRAIERAKDQVGSLAEGDPAAVGTSSPTQLAWSLAATRGRLAIEILLTPQRPPRVQELEVTAIPEPAAALTALAAGVIEALAAGDDRTVRGEALGRIALAEGADRDAMEAAIRSVLPLASGVRLGDATGGDGTGSASWEVAAGERKLELSVEADGGGALRVLRLVPRGSQADTTGVAWPRPDLGERVRLRAVRDEDLPRIHEQQSDRTATRMAAFGARDWAAFRTHWDRIRRDPTVRARVIEVDGDVCGTVLAFLVDGRREVGYWLGREWWGHGLATAALRAFLPDVPERPVYGAVAAHNRASARVLEKCGFVRAEDEPILPGDEEVELHLYRLD